MNSNLELNANWQKQNGTWVHVDVARLLSGKALLAYKKNLVLNFVQDEMLIGHFLGDASSHFNRTAKNPGFGFVFAQCLKRADYVDHVYGNFKPFVGTPPKINLIGGIKPGKPARYEARFKTYTHDVFRPYYESFYPLVDGKRTKRVPQNIGDLLTPRGLAYWFMDDGSTSRSKSGLNGCVLNCQGFAYDDCLKLRDALKSGFNLSTSVHKDKTYFKLYVRMRSLEQFLNLIRPYIHKDFLYKI